MYTQLKKVIDKDPDGPMSKHISNVFFRFVKEKKLTKLLPTFTLYDLKFVRAYLDDGVSVRTDILEDFEID